MSETKPVAWVIPGQDNANDRGFLDAMAWQEGEFTTPLYPASALTSLMEENAELKAEKELMLDMLRKASSDLPAADRGLGGAGAFVGSARDPIAPTEGVRTRRPQGRRTMMEPVARIDASYGNDGMLLAAYQPNMLPVGTELVRLSDAEARIKELEAKLAEADALIEAQQHDFAQNNIRNAENAHRAEAAEALLKEAVPLLDHLSRETTTDHIGDDWLTNHSRPFDTGN